VNMTDFSPAWCLYGVNHRKALAFQRTL